uniref:Leucine-rich repeat-containing protein 14 n=1 Tax=Ficedula albicollis TaxID=59894 RepID=U3K443_FICAL
MDSLLFLCARRVAAQRPLPALPADLYHVLFQAAFLDGRPLVLHDLVATWPFPVLNMQRLVGHRELLRDHPSQDCVEAVIQAVVAQLRRELEEPGCDFSLRVLDMTGLSDSVAGRTTTGLSVWCSTKALAKACVEVAAVATATPQSPGVDVHAHLFVDRRSYRILRDALQTGAASSLHLKCREFKAVDISASEIVTLLESLDPSCLRRVELCFNNLGLTGLSVILPHLSRFPELRSLKVRYSNVDVRHLMPKSAMRIRSVARQLGMLPSLRELNLGSSQLSGNLPWNWPSAPSFPLTSLESLELGYCFLVPADLTFLSQSIHAPALKMLDLSFNNILRGLLEPLQLLLEETSASLLYLDLSHCHVADSHLAALLPTLLRCSRLRFLGLYGNSLSTAAIKDLLQKTLELPDLHLVVYPVPEDCYKPDQQESGWDFVVDKELLAATTVEISQILENSGRTDIVWTYNPCVHGVLDYFSL